MRVRLLFSCMCCLFAFRFCMLVCLGLLFVGWVFLCQIRCDLHVSQVYCQCGMLWCSWVMCYYTGFWVQFYASSGVLSFYLQVGVISVVVSLVLFWCACFTLFASNRFGRCVCFVIYNVMQLCQLFVGVCLRVMEALVCCVVLVLIVCVSWGFWFQFTFSGS